MSGKKAVTAAAQARPRRRKTGDEVVARLREAASVEFEASGYTRARTASIARRAGVSETLLFRHFGSKANLFNDTVFNRLQQHFETFAERHGATDQGARDEAGLRRKYIGEMQEFFSHNADAMRLLVNSATFAEADLKGVGQLTALHDYLTKAADLAFARMKEIGAPQPQIDPRLAASISFATVMSCIIFRDWLFPMNGVTDEAIDQAVTTFVLSGLGNLPRDDASGTDT